MTSSRYETRRSRRPRKNKPAVQRFTRISNRRSYGCSSVVAWRTYPDELVCSTFDIPVGSVVAHMNNPAAAAVWLLGLRLGLALVADAGYAPGPNPVDHCKEPDGGSACTVNVWIIINYIVTHLVLPRFQRLTTKLLSCYRAELNCSSDRRIPTNYYNPDNNSKYIFFWIFFEFECYSDCP